MTSLHVIRGLPPLPNQKPWLRLCGKTVCWGQYFIGVFNDFIIFQLKADTA